MLTSNQTNIHLTLGADAAPEFQERDGSTWINVATNVAVFGTPAEIAAWADRIAAVARHAALDDRVTA